MTTIVLRAGPEEELDWQREKVTAAGCPSIIWEMDWGNHTGILTDESVFASQALALKTWTSVFGEFVEKTKGVLLYKGPACPYLQTDSYFEWLEKREDTLFHRRLYSSGILLEYLHRLGSFLPDTLPLLVELDVSGIEKAAEQALLFSPERTLHLHVVLCGGKIPIPNDKEAVLGVCLPCEEHWTQEIVDRLETVLESLQGRIYRLVPEAMLNEQWDGLDEILVLEQALTKKGRRMLQGFAAAGGIATYM